MPDIFVFVFICEVVRVGVEDAGALGIREREGVVVERGPAAA